MEGTTELRGMLYAVFLVSLTAGVLQIFSPGGENSALRRSFRYLVSLAVTLALLWPLSGCFQLLSGMADGELAVAQTEETGEEEMAIELLDSITDRSLAILAEKEVRRLEGVFSMTPQTLTLHLFCDRSDYAALQLTGALLISSEPLSEADALALAAAVKESFGCPAAVYRLEGEEKLLLAQTNEGEAVVWNG